MNLSKLFEKNEEKEFTTFPTTLETYVWYKPFLIIIIAAIIALVISFAVFKIMGANPNAGGIERIIYSAISMIALIPGLYIGFKLVYKIPFSTQIAPVRKWNWSIYIKAYIITLIVYGVLQIITLLPAVLCILITIGYILQAPEGLQLPSMIANAIAIVATAIITVIFVKKYRNI